MSVRFAVLILVTAIFTACGGYSSPSTPTATPTPTPEPSGGTTVTISSGASTQTTTAFGTNPLTISTGTTVSWLNNDNTTHTSTSTGNNGWNSGNIAPGASFSHTFSAAGSYQYNCTLHTNMVGTVNVQ